MDRDQIDVQAGLVKAKVMDILRPLRWQVREAVCADLQYNHEFCWGCGMDTPDGRRCQCQNDE